MNVAVPKYFKQQGRYTCSLASLRMAADHLGISMTEQQLVDMIAPDYGQDFKSVWNPTLARIGCEVGLDVSMYADWPLFAKDNIERAVAQNHQGQLDYMKYENPNDSDEIPADLAISYADMLRAVELGCATHNTRLNEQLLRKLIAKNNLLIASFRVGMLYGNDDSNFHSVLFYKIENDHVYFHDPWKGPAQRSTVDQVIAATTGTGAVVALTA